MRVSELLWFEFQLWKPCVLSTMPPCSVFLLIFPAPFKPISLYLILNAFLLSICLAFFTSVKRHWSLFHALLFLGTLTLELLIIDWFLAFLLWSILSRLTEDSFYFKWIQLLRVKYFENHVRFSRFSTLGETYLLQNHAIPNFKFLERELNILKLLSYILNTSTVL